MESIVVMNVALKNSFSDNSPMNLRRETRFSITTVGRYRKGTGIGYDVAIKDLSEYGCQFFDKFGRLEIDDTLSLWIGKVGPIVARVVWVHRRIVGLEFDKPLYPAVLEHVVRQNAGVDKS